MLDTQNLVKVVKCTITTGLERRLARKRKKEEKKFLPGLHLIIPLLVESDEFTALSPSHCSAYKSPDHLPFHSRLS